MNPNENCSSKENLPIPDDSIKRQPLLRGKSDKKAYAAITHLMVQQTKNSDNKWKMENTYLHELIDAARKSDTKTEIGKPVTSGALAGITRESLEANLRKTVSP